MSKKSRRPTRAHRHDRDRRASRATVAVLVGWYQSEDDRLEAQRQSHDSLIAMLGPARRGGVGWRHYTGVDAAGLLDRLEETETSGELVDHYRRLRAMLAEHGGWLVMAEAEAVQP